VRSLLLIFNVVQSSVLFLLISDYGWGMILTTIAANTLSAICAIVGLHIGRPTLFVPNIFCKVIEELRRAPGAYFRKKNSALILPLFFKVDTL
jgi:hypothetical protein